MKQWCSFRNHPSIHLKATKKIVPSQLLRIVSHKRTSSLLWSLRIKDTEIDRSRRIDGCSPCKSNQQNLFRTPNAVAFRVFARQCGSARLRAFAMRMGRAAIPLVKQYVMPVAKDFGNILLSAFLPEISNVISVKKRRKAVLERTLEKSA